MPFTHRYHAEATALEGNLRQPHRQPLERQAHAKIPETGGYLSQHAESFRAEGIVSYDAAHTQAAGHLEENKPNGGFKSLSTSLVENLNILNIVTADRVAGTISTEHPLNGYVPKVTFLGSHFHNLRIAGFSFEVELDFDLLDDIPEEKTYTWHDGFLKRMAERFGIFRREDSPAPQALKELFGPERTDAADSESGLFSLVKNIEIKGLGKFPGTVHGHVIELPHFGRISVAEGRIVHNDPNKGEKNYYKQTLFELSMLKIEMGCQASGMMAMSNGKTNGNSVPPPGS